MPRRNKTIIHSRAQPVAGSESTKVKYRTKQDALAAAKRAKMYNPDLLLTPYQSPVDTYWYLTGKSDTSRA